MRHQPRRLREINSIARPPVPRDRRVLAAEPAALGDIEDRERRDPEDGPIEASPTLVEVTRGATVESRHRGAIAVSDSAGALDLAIGDVERPVFARSCIKPLQALPLVESGAADRFGFSDAELALACGSHGGEPEHVETAAGALARLGLGAEALECGAHWPLNDRASRALAASGSGPNALHNNCSGKHAGFLCLACGLETATADYLSPDHPVQREVTAAIALTTGVDLATASMGVDGCGAPTFAMPLAAIARGLARFGTGDGLPRSTAAAAGRLMAAGWSAPMLVAGSGRFDTEIMQVLAGRAFVKTGAEGVHAAALPELGLGIAIKIDDGARRAAEAAMAATLIRLLKPDGEAAERLDARARRPLVNFAGEDVGAIRAVEALFG